MAKTLVDVMQEARNAGAPLVAVVTANQMEVVTRVAGAAPHRAATANGDVAVVKIMWDAARGVEGINEGGRAFVAAKVGKGDDAPDTSNPQTALEIAAKLPAEGLFFMLNAHRFIQDAFVSTALLRLREPYKADGRTLVAVGPQFDPPMELRQDFVVLDDPLPDDEQQRALIVKLAKGNGLEVDAASLTRAVDAVRGLSSFAAETVVAMSLRKSGIDVDSLWERKQVQIRQIRGLKLKLKGTRFADTGGNAQLLADVRDIMEDEIERPAAIVWWDEFEKSGAASSGGNVQNTVDLDFRARFLTWMEESKHDGIILVGGAGTGKSLAAQSIGPEFGLPTIIMDPGEMKGPLVGNSEAYVREALKTMDALAKGRLFVVATCNRLEDIAPEIRRRFTSGIYYVDLPTADERRAIATIQLKAHGLSLDLVERVVSLTDNWTGAEIRNLCRIARRPASQRMKDPLAYAATKVVPVFLSAPRSIESLRALAEGAFLSANHPGVYTRGVVEVPGEIARRVRAAQAATGSAPREN